MQVKNGQAKLDWIKNAVGNGYEVHLTTYLTDTIITKKNLCLVSVNPATGSLYVQHGKKKLCYDGVKITAYKQ